MFLFNSVRKCEYCGAKFNSDKDQCPSCGARDWTDVKSSPLVKLKSKLKSKPEPKPESKSKPKPEPQLEPKPEPKPEPKLESRPEFIPEPQPKLIPKSNPKATQKPKLKSKSRSIYILPAVIVLVGVILAALILVSASIFDVDGIFNSNQTTTNEQSSRVYQLAKVTIDNYLPLPDNIDYLNRQEYKNVLSASPKTIEILQAPKVDGRTKIKLHYKTYTRTVEADLHERTGTWYFEDDAGNVFTPSGVGSTLQRSHGELKSSFSNKTLVYIESKEEIAEPSFETKQFKVVNGAAE